MQPGSPPQPPTPSRLNTTVVLIVVVVIVAAAITAAVLYVRMMNGFSTGMGPGKPVVTLAVAGSTATGTSLAVVSANPAVSPANYKVNLQVGTVFGSAGPAPLVAGTSTSIVVSGAIYTVTWSNPGGSGDLTRGDGFAVTYPTGADAPPGGTQMSFYLIWASDGITVTQVSFTVL